MDSLSDNIARDKMPYHDQPLRRVAAAGENRRSGEPIRRRLARIASARAAKPTAWGMPHYAAPFNGLIRGVSGLPGFRRDLVGPPLRWKAEMGQ